MAVAMARRLDGQEDATANGARGVQEAVVVHGGARDSYQLALGLSDVGLLDRLVTDLFWPADREWATEWWVKLPPGLRELVDRRTAAGLPSNKVLQCPIHGLRGLLLDRVPMVPFSVRQRSMRAADARLGKVAGRRARMTGSGLVSYSYFGYDAMREYGGAAMLFQVHPHPTTVRRILREELSANPDCAASLQQEWELALPERDYAHLVEEPKMATRLLVASSFTRTSLIENGCKAESISVVPYGVNGERFCPPTGVKNREARQLQLLFVGRINQRKGIKYLLEALRQFDPKDVMLTICGRVVDGLELFQPFGDQVKIRPSVSAGELVKAYQEADLFVFPSVAEGFGQVLLEAMACGLPILSTTHTAAPDLIEDGVQGYVVEPRRPDLLAERISWAMTHRIDLAKMGEAARIRAEDFTWQRFRNESAKAVRLYLRMLPERPTA